jgi:hypothetical protein
VQIETDKQKVQAAAAPPEEAAAPRMRRVRPTPPAMPNEPLVQIETRHGETANP